MKAMLLELVHSQFWDEAAKMFVYTYNLLPRKKLGGRSPWSPFMGRSDPPIPRFAFGEKISFWTKLEHASKLKPRGHLGLFLGPGISAAQTSFPGCHRVWHLDKQRLTIVSDVRSMQERPVLDRGISSAPLGDQPAVRSRRISRDGIASGRLAVEAEGAAHQRPGHSPEPAAPSGAAGLEGLPVAPGLLETVSPGHDLCDESAPGLRVDGPRAPLLGTGVLTRGQGAILDAALGGSLPT